MRPIDRFMQKIDFHGPIFQNLGPCWLWIAALNDDGYGVFDDWLAHRWYYDYLTSNLPDYLVLDHLCRNRSCVNYDHLELVTAQVNMSRGIGLAAINAAKTHCINGHPFDLFNTYLRPDGDRDCRQCGSERSRLRKLRSDGALCQCGCGQLLKNKGTNFLRNHDKRRVS